jgi:hypothetical protein
MRDAWITNMDAFLGKFITFGIVTVVAWSSVSCAKDEDIIIYPIHHPVWNVLQNLFPSSMRDLARQ